MKTLFKYIAAAFLFCAAYNANAQTFVCNLSFPRDIIAACPLLQKGDTASFGLFAFATKTKADLGNFTFTTITTSGVPLTGQGTLIANTSGGTFYVTAMTIGDLIGDNCSFLNINLAVSAKIFVFHQGNPHNYF